jgi:lysophospholipase L1-like esterase
MKKITRILHVSFLILFGLITMSSTPTVYFIGDSTMADYDPAVYPNQRGWGQMFRNFLTGDINFVNAGRNGRSTRSFYTGSDSLWAGVRTKIKSGDYVFIQFAHNDEKLNGLSDTVKTGGIATAPWSDFQMYLRNFITESRNLGATPVLVTPIVRCYFAGDSITLKGRHNLATDDSTLNYVRAMKAVGRQLNVAIIDHTSLTRKYAEGLGATNAYSTIYVTSDQTHLNPTGATIYAQLAVQEMLKQNILTGHLNASPNLIITPLSIDFGNSYVSAFAGSKFSISGLSLSPSTGNVTITAPDGFLVSQTSGGAFAASLEIPYTGGNLSATDIYIHFQPSQTKSYNDSITVSYGSGTAKKIAVKGMALAMSGGIAAAVNLPLTANPTPVVSGPVIALDETWVGMYAKNYATIATWPSGIAGTTTQRNSISATNSNIIDTWPAGEIDINSNRYIQFAVKANPGTSFTIDSIGLYAGAAGGSGLKYRVLYAKKEDFSNPVTLEDKTSNTGNTMVALSYKPLVQITDLEGFYLRFYPWYNGTASLKYLCLSNLTIKGQVISTTSNGIKQLKTEPVSAYPNPSSGIFYLKTSGNNSVAEIYNQTGVLIRKQQLQDSALDLSTFSTGIYVLKLQSGQSAQTTVLIKK